MGERLRIAVLGYVVRRPLGGGTWHTLQYALGLAQLGHDVCFVEDSEDFPCCYDPTRHVTDTDPSYGLAYADRVFTRVGLGERWAYHDGHRDAWCGPRAADAAEFCASADLVVSISGPLRGWTRGARRRCYVDTDPAFDQVRALTEPDRAAHLGEHEVCFTYGVNIPAGTARVPDDGIGWLPARPPVVLGAWPVTPGPANGAFTTVMQWESYSAREYDGVRYGMKAESFQPLMELPARTSEVLEVALGTPHAPRAELERHGWRLVDPLAVTEDPWTYQNYLQGSKGELTVAKHGYVVSDSGWFSERSANYLACGRPVITQDTGFGAWLPAGEGLLAFDSVDSALAAIDAVCTDYGRHCRAARELAREHFASDRVLAALVASAMDGA